MNPEIEGVQYDKKKKLCIILSCDNIDGILGKLEKTVDFSYSIWIAVTITSPTFAQCILKCAKLGFEHPTITNETPLNQNIPHSVALTRSMKHPGKNSTDVIIMVKYLLQQYKRHGCSMRVKFSEQAINFLRKTSKMGHTKNHDHTISQKELTGVLHIDKMTESNGNILFIIGCAESAVEPGKEENVNVSPTRYNFHSHPEEAYVRHKVNIAWPSLTDYLGVLTLGNETIFHCVATLEGLYVVSFGEYWVNKIDKVSKSFIKKHYDVDRTKNISPYEYMHKINHILYKGEPIFIVKYLPWNEAASTIFSVNYKKDGMTCRVRDR